MAVAVGSREASRGREGEGRGWEEGTRASVARKGGSSAAPKQTSPFLPRLNEQRTDSGYPCCCTGSDCVDLVSGSLLKAGNETQQVDTLVIRFKCCPTWIVQVWARNPTNRTAVRWTHVFHRDKREISPDQLTVGLLTVWREKKLFRENEYCSYIGMGGGS